MQRGKPWSRNGVVGVTAGNWKWLVCSVGFQMSEHSQLSISSHFCRKHGRGRRCHTGKSKPHFSTVKVVNKVLNPFFPQWNLVDLVSARTALSTSPSYFIPVQTLDVVFLRMFAFSMSLLILFKDAERDEMVWTCWQFCRCQLATGETVTTWVTTGAFTEINCGVI